MNFFLLEQFQAQDAYKFFVLSLDSKERHKI